MFNSSTEENAHEKIKRVRVRLRLPTCIHTPQGNILTGDKEIADHICEYFATAGKGEVVEERKEGEIAEGKIECAEGWRVFTQR